MNTYKKYNLICKN